MKTELQSRTGVWFPVLELTWNGSTGLRRYASMAAAHSVAGGYEPRVLAGGWGPVTRGVSERPSPLGFGGTDVTLADTDMTITAILEGGTNPRRSPAVIKWGSPNVAYADWFTLFSGILDSWQRSSSLDWKLNFKTDDLPLRGFVPRFAVIQGDFPGATQANRGIYIPIVYGIHDAGGLTSQGMLKTVNTSLDATNGYHYVVSLGALKSVDRVYKDGVLQTVGTHYNVEYPIVADRVLTRIKFLSATTAANVITCDATGLTAAGDGTGTVLTNPCEIIRHFLCNFVYNDWKAGAWNSYSSAPIDLTSFGQADAYAAAFHYEGSLYVGGSTEQRRCSDVVDDWLKSHPMHRLYWSNDGKLACKALDHRWPGYIDAPWIRSDSAQDAEVGSSLLYSLDSAQLVRQVSLSYLYGQADGKFWASLDLEDPAVSERVTESFQLIDSTARFQ